MMKKTTVVCLAILIATFAQVVGQTQGPKSVFWEVSGKGLEKNSYLFGTIHIMPRDDFESFDIADEKLLQSGQLVLEIDIDVPLKTQIQWARRFMLPEGENLMDYMDEDEYQRIRSYAIDSLGVKEMMFNNYMKMKPLAFYSALIPNIMGEKLEGYDMYFSKLARKNDLPIAQLETFDYQLAIFDSISLEKQIDMFFSEENDLRSSLTELLDVYREQDIYKMASLFSEQDSEYEEFEYRLLVERNHNWAVLLDTMMHEKSSFIAVGAGHLAGEHGLIRLLREKGYTVEAIMLKE